MCYVGVARVCGRGACVYGELGVSSFYYKVCLFVCVVHGRAGEGFWVLVGHYGCRHFKGYFLIYRPFRVGGA